MTRAHVDESIFRDLCRELNQKLGIEDTDPTRYWRLRRIEVAKISEQLPPGGSLLDVGAGPGFVPRYFHALGYRVISTDYPVTGGTEALRSLIDHGIQGHYLEVGVTPLPLADDSIDVAFAGNVIEHLPGSPRKFVADLRRVLKPGGVLIVDTKNAVDLKTRLKVLAGVHNWAPLKSFHDLDCHPHHHKEYTLSELRELLELGGFEHIAGFAFECFFQDSLKKFRTLQAMGKGQSEKSRFGGGFNFLQPYEYARLVFLVLVKLFPGLRSDILVLGQKPR